MAINLSKGGRIDLSKEPNLKKLRAELRWTANGTDTGTDFDLDCNVFVCKYNSEGKPMLISDAHFIFYNNLELADGSVIHSADDTTGEADGEDVWIDFSKLAANVDEISFIVTIHEAAERKQNFGQVSGASIAIFNEDTNECIAGYQLDDDFSTEVAVQFGSVYKKQSDGKWTFKAVGTGFNKGLAEFVRGYGGNV